MIRNQYQRSKHQSVLQSFGSPLRKENQVSLPRLSVQSSPKSMNMSSFR